MKYLLGLWLLALGIANMAITMQTPGVQILQSAGAGALIAMGGICLVKAWRE